MRALNPTHWLPAPLRVDQDNCAAAEKYRSGSRPSPPPNTPPSAPKSLLQLLNLGSTKRPRRSKFAESSRPLAWSTMTALTYKIAQGYDFCDDALEGPWAEVFEQGACNLSAQTRRCDRAGKKRSEKYLELCGMSREFSPSLAGRILKWPTRADCKSAGLRLPWFESRSYHHFKSRQSFRSAPVLPGLGAAGF